MIFNCDQENCKYECKKKYNLKTHKALVHNINVTWYNCDLCEYKCKLKGCLKLHKVDIHDINVTWYNCDLCDYKCKRQSSLKIHKSLVHDINVTWYNCDLCEYKCKQKGHLKSHFNSIHSPEGQARQKKEEHKVAKLLEKNSIVVERETRVNFSCFESGKHWALIDFTIYRKDCIILLEVDENQHKYGEYYSVSCDMKRMSHILTAIRCEGKEHTVLFLRYNPHSFEIEYEKQKISQKDRQESLVNFINNYKPSREGLEIKYMFYDKEQSEDKIPLIAKTPDYNKEMVKCII
jgi:hypothetical protein